MTHGLTERTWPSLILSPISVNNHVVTVSSTRGLKTKQHVQLSKAGIDTQTFEIKRVVSSTEIMVGPTSTNIKKTTEAVLFDGGILSLSEQSRNKLGDAPIMRAVYEEEPTIALRTVDVDYLGNIIGSPDYDLESTDLDARFKYGTCFELETIREYAPSEKIYEGPVNISTSGTITVSALEPWMVVGGFFFAMEVDTFGVITPIAEFEISNLDPLTGVIGVTPNPAANYVGLSIIDGSIGDKVKVTNFDYGHAFEITNIYTSYSTVTADDIIKKVR